ncbi:anti-sigma factor [Paenibacillus sp. NPDC058174]|uniref:anti-sigma factor n=1 Tax=Paenibacillus sp. NPDC058174 TaxID=3346366 RepID=UPI0036D90EFB
MSEDFKRKLQNYAEGKLTDEEREEVEREMEKMEVYQAYLEEVMTNSNQKLSGDGGEAGDARNRMPAAPLKEAVIIRRGKWKARIMNVFTLLSVLLIFAVISMIITSVFYGSGTPNRMETYRNVVESAVAVSQPNMKVNVNGAGNAFFTMDFTGKLNKRVGDEEITAADFSMRFLMNLASAPTITWQNRGGSIFFYHPDYKPAVQSEQKETNKGGEDRQDRNEWAKLEKLPEGTVAEVYVSLDRLFSTDELLKQFEHRNMEPVWFAVDTGLDPKRADSGGVIINPVGFPYMPVWQADDLTVDFYSEKKTKFGKTVSSGGHYPSLEAYGDGEKRNGYFKKTLYMLQKNKGIAAKAAPFLQLDYTIDYVDKHGVKLYGVVITGPVKELLKLREESWIRDLRVGEVQLWNWQPRE